MPRIWKPLLGVLTAAAVGSAMAQVKPGIAVVEIDVRQPEA